MFVSVCFSIAFRGWLQRKKTKMDDNWAFREGLEYIQNER